MLRGTKQLFPREIRMNGSNVLTYPVHLTERTKRPFYIRIGILAGVLMNQPEHPKGWTWNPAVITLCLIIASLLVGGGYFIGRQSMMIESIQQKTAETRAIADDARKLATYSARDVDNSSGHTKSTVKKTAEEVKGEQ